MNEHPSVFRYLIEDNPPTLWGAVESFVEDHNITPGQFLAIFGHLPSTVRDMCEHKRQMSVLEFARFSIILNLSPDEIAARYVANMPAIKIGEIERAQKARNVREVVPERVMDSMRDQAKRYSDALHQIRAMFPVINAAREVISHFREGQKCDPDDYSTQMPYGPIFRLKQALDQWDKEAEQ